ncbi:hypothetical protein KKD52_08840 [Myxococcota bacterium]|nr:hypothetical protein [Myxococcota bacterium]
MKRFILAVMLLSLVQCTTKQSDKPSTPLPPPTNTTDPVQPVPLEPEVAVSALPSDLKVEALAEKQMISVNVGPVVNQIQQLVAASLPHLAFIPGIDQISATIPAMVPQVFGKMGREIVRDMVPHHWRSLLDMADLSTGIYVTYVAREPRGYTSVVRFSAESTELEARLSRGDLGQFRKTSWGGRLSFAGHMNHKGARDLFVAFDQDRVLLSEDIRLLHPAMELLRKQIAAVPAGFPFFAMVHNLDRNTDLYLNRISREFSTSERRELEPVLRILKPEFESLKHLAFSAGLDGNLALVMDMHARAVDNPTGPMVKAAMTPVDIGDLAPLLPGKPILFGLDKSSLDFLRPLYKKLQGELLRSRASVRNADEALLMGQFSSVIDLVDKFFEWSADSQVGMWSLRKGQMHLGGMLQLKLASSGKDMMDSVDKLMKTWNPKTMLALLSPEAKKELAWLPKVLEIRTKSTQFEKRPALVVTMKFNWKNVPKHVQNEQLTIFSQFVGKQLEFALVHDSGRMFLMAGALWKDELKDIMAARGKLPDPRLKSASESTMSLSAFDLNGFSTYLFGEILKIKFPDPLSSDAKAFLQAAIKHFGTMTGYSWMTFSAGLQPDRQFRMRFTMEKEAWPLWVSWGYLMSRVL